jgi:hypothetical protein
LGVVTALVAASIARSDPRPLPSIDEVKTGLLRRAESEAQDRRALERDYSHTRIRLREERNPKGTLKSRDEQRDELRPDADSRAGGKNGGGEAGRERAYEERDVRVTGEVLDRFRFEIEGREMLEGEEVLRVRFRPVSERLKARGLLEKFINRTEGTLWLRESGMEMVRARLRLMEPVGFLGGIVGAVYALEASFERSVTAEGVWFTRKSKWQVDYREFLVRKLVHFTETREDVQRVAGTLDEVATVTGGGGTE